MTPSDTTSGATKPPGRRRILVVAAALAVLVLTALIAFGCYAAFTVGTYIFSDRFDAPACIEERSLTDGPQAVPEALGAADELIWVGAGTSVIALDPETGRSAVVHNSEFELRPHSLSPDGQALLAVGDCNADNLFLLRTDGSDLVQVTSRWDRHRPLGFAPDGSSVITWQNDVDFAGDIWRVDLVDRGRTPLTGPELVASELGSMDTDGSAIVIVSDKTASGGTRIVEIEPSSGAIATVLDDVDRATNPVRWADGTVVFEDDGVRALTQDGQIETWGVDRPDAPIVHAPAHNRVAWATGDGLAAYTEDDELELVPVAPGTVPLTWSPAGGRLLVASPAGNGVELMILEVGSGARVQALMALDVAMFEHEFTRDPSVTAVWGAAPD